MADLAAALYPCSSCLIQPLVQPMIWPQIWHLIGRCLIQKPAVQVRWQQGCCCRRGGGCLLLLLLLLLLPRCWCTCMLHACFGVVTKPALDLRSSIRRAAGQSRPLTRSAVGRCCTMGA
jgi:hypothetical protein